VKQTWMTRRALGRCATCMRHSSAINSRPKQRRANPCVAHKKQRGAPLPGHRHCDVGHPLELHLKRIPTPVHPSCARLLRGHARAAKTVRAVGGLWRPPVKGPPERRRPAASCSRCLAGLRATPSPHRCQLCPAPSQLRSPTLRTSPPSSPPSSFLSSAPCRMSCALPGHRGRPRGCEHPSYFQVLSRPEEAREGSSSTR